MARRTGRTAAGSLALASCAAAVLSWSALRSGSPGAPAPPAAGAFAASPQAPFLAASRGDAPLLPRSRTRLAAAADVEPPTEQTVLEETLAGASVAFSLLSRALACSAIVGLALGLVAASPQPALAAPAWSHNDIPAWTKDYPVCAEKSQSPIDIETLSTRDVDIKDSGKTTLFKNVEYQPLRDREIVNNTHVMQVNGDFGTFQLPDGTYAVKQFHFHFPAEHEINGKLGAGELHIVHQKLGASGTDGLAVIGVVLEETPYPFGGEHKFLSELGFDKGLPGEGAKQPIPGMVDLNLLHKELEGEFYHYSGSLTTPPCAEKVHWYVARNAAPVTPDMIAKFRARYPAGDNRPVQARNGRKVVLDQVFVDDKEFAKVS